MRTSLFLSTLFAVTLVGGAALAEKPHDAGQGREPRVVEQLRAHGDIVDKSYSSPDKASRAVDHSTQAATSTRQVKNPLDRSASRVNCSDSGADCGAKSSAARAATVESSSSATGRSARIPAFLDKILGSDRTDFNEADMDEGMSTRAARRAWERAGASHHSTSHAEGASAASLAAQKQVSRYDEQYSSSRVSCNEGDMCMASSKETKKEWSYDAIKAGTWQGPEKAAPTPAAVRIREYRAAEGHARGQEGGKGRQGAGASAQHEEAH
jgi:hypothetical protein